MSAPTPTRAQDQASEIQHEATQSPHEASQEPTQAVQAEPQAESHTETPSAIEPRIQAEGDITVDDSTSDYSEEL